ncbi:nicotinamide riboside transporter PnuC [Vibrio ouci]|uniref:Nicotinamide riboside transporter PnuC n=1 Tax=Vibrio ouci TaxID=2499078 RepID=A0A4Y8W9U2_9VIBR|nr:nicotinamide riboside transporter PnuC [Vibrio ouci]TFH89416.1 nicotinamide riboside transporter PnuC [Vibrio ouci]
MDLVAFVDINNTLVTIPIGDGYTMSWIEALATFSGLLLLQSFFFSVNIYGWYIWTTPNAQGEILEVRWLSKPTLFLLAGVCMVAITLLTLYIDPFFFALANAVLSVVAQILLVRKYVESRLLWVVICTIGAGISAIQGVYAMSVQYAILVFISVNGIRAWARTAIRNGDKTLAQTAAWNTVMSKSVSRYDLNTFNECM